MSVNIRFEFDLFDLNLVLRLLAFLLAFGLIVSEFAIIDDFANGRIRCRNDFNEVQAFIFCEAIRFFDGNNADLLAS